MSSSQDKPDKINIQTRFKRTSQPSLSVINQQIKNAEKAIELKLIDCCKEQNFIANLSNFIFLQQQFKHPIMSSISSQYICTLEELKNTQETPQFYFRFLQFWLKSFFKILDQIIQCTENFALASFKNRNDNDNRKPTGENKKTRKGWDTSETQKLQKIIDQNQQVSSEILKDLSKEFNRTIISIQSKIQKLQKLRKDQNEKDKFDDLSLQKKIVTILKGNPEGLSREQVLAKLQQQFEMGEQTIWKKSASQLLCSSKNVQKVKGRYSLSEAYSGKLPRGTSTKIKVIRCLLAFENHSASLKQIIQKHRQLFGTNQKQKTIQANISKTLRRYAQFDRKNCKTVYRYVEVQQGHSIHGGEEMESSS